MIEAFGRSVREVRQTRHWTQAQLAGRMSEVMGREVRPLTITRIEAADRPTPLDEAVALAQILGISLDALSAGNPGPSGPPAYLITHAKSQRGDILVEDPTLTLDIRDGWAIFTDHQGVALALPAEQVACIQRVDEGQDQKPAPQKE